MSMAQVIDKVAVHYWHLHRQGKIVIQEVCGFGEAATTWTSDTVFRNLLCGALVRSLRVCDLTLVGDIDVDRAQDNAHKLFANVIKAIQHGWSGPYKTARTRVTQAQKTTAQRIVNNATDMLNDFFAAHPTIAKMFLAHMLGGVKFTLVNQNEASVVQISAGFLHDGHYVGMMRKSIDSFELIVLEMDELPGHGLQNDTMLAMGDSYVGIGDGGSGVVEFVHTHAFDAPNSAHPRVAALARVPHRARSCSVRVQQHEPAYRIQRPLCGGLPPPLGDRVGLHPAQLWRPDRVRMFAGGHIFSD